MWPLGIIGFNVHDFSCQWSGHGGLIFSDESGLEALADWVWNAWIVDGGHGMPRQGHLENASVAMDL